MVPLIRHGQQRIAVLDRGVVASTAKSRGRTRAALATIHSGSSVHEFVHELGADDASAANEIATRIDKCPGRLLLTSELGHS